MTKTILITGASRGIGHAAATLLAQQGHVVFGASRQAAEIEGANFSTLNLDVQDDASVTACIDQVLRRAGRLDVLINNAGISLGGAAEEASLAEARSLFETNFFGVVRLTNAVLPHMREAGRGLIVNIGSMAGIIGVPYLGLYAASKHAVAGYTTALRYELKPFGVGVALVEPGDAATSMSNARPASVIAAYDGVRERAAGIHDVNMRDGIPADRIARTLLKIIESPRPRLRYPVAGGEQRLVPWMKRLLPEGMIERILRASYKLDRGL